MKPKPRSTAIGFARALALAAAASLLSTGASAQALSAPQALAACNAAEASSVLQAAAPLPGPKSAAQGIWLNAQWLRWPGLDAAASAASAKRYALLGEGLPRIELQVMPDAAVPSKFATRFPHVKGGVALKLPDERVRDVAALLRGPVRLVQEDASGQVLAATETQHPGALDALYGTALEIAQYGVSLQPQHTRFIVWAPTARTVWLCLYPKGRQAPASRALPMDRDDIAGSWNLRLPGSLRGQSYTYLVEVYAPGSGWVRNRVTDPYSISLNTDSQRSFIADLDDAALKPPGWDSHRAPQRVQAPTDMAIYELHVRDFSISDDSVPLKHRGKYTAFTQPGSRGMRHLAALSRAGITDVHLLPVFDIATVPEAGCTTPKVPPAAADSEAQQAAVMAQAGADCFNWGYDPWHFNAPEGSYASDAEDGAVRVREFRQMVMGLHRTGLRVGMDVVYNHTTASGQAAKSVLDRLVPGYYQRLNAAGQVEMSTCCDNTATEHAMMAKLMIDSAVLWARHYRIDGFRFDLMGHQPREAMERLQAAVNQATGRRIDLLGEGWNFGEVANGARFVQASQLSLNGSGIATFSDRMRDAVRGGGCCDGGTEQISRQGYISGFHSARNALAPPSTTQDFARLADLVRVGLAGSLRGFELDTAEGPRQRLEQIVYAGTQPAGYVTQPGEVVNYVENHDNPTLWDALAYKLPTDTPASERARVQTLGSAIVALSQGIAYFHAGQEMLRSKSMDRNSYDSGDWFNRMDFTFTTNHFGTGLPPKQENGSNWPLMKPLLSNANMNPAAQDIRFAREAFMDLMRIRSSSSLFRLRTAQDVRQRLRLLNTGPQQEPAVLVGHLKAAVPGLLNGKPLPGAGFGEIAYFINVAPEAKTLVLPALAGEGWHLHPVHRAPGAADRRASQEAKFDATATRFTVPARTAVVWVRR
jgi:pullulanase/glycogen debranching enzyme